MSVKLTVLLVEDDASLRDWCSGSLEDMGYAVLSAGSVVEALVLSRQTVCPIELAVLDLGLPPTPNEATAGQELMRLLILDRPALKVLVLTGQDEPSVALQAIRLGAFDFLNKPASSHKAKGTSRVRPNRPERADRAVSAITTTGAL